MLIFSYGLLAGLATTMGALLFLIIGPPVRKAVAFALGLAAGVMLAVVVIDLFPSAWGQPGGGLKSTLGFAGGWLMIWWADCLLETREAPESDNASFFRRLGILTALGIAFHDLPEGMAIALGYEAAEQLGPIIAVAIGLHNIPEGIATAAPLRA
ncbi:MAG: ZIP family metal transporter, partial [Syntrophomonadaceae bacterium]|nr:ZIP family metal transporter [Syntrophomonadaceae bacterium]